MHPQAVQILGGDDLAPQAGTGGAGGCELRGGVGEGVSREGGVALRGVRL